MVVVLPAPLGPRNPCTSPVRTSSSSPSRARVGPKVLTSPEIEMAVAIAGCRLLWRYDGRSPASHATLVSRSCEWYRGGGAGGRRGRCRARRGGGPAVRRAFRPRPGRGGHAPHAGAG